MKWILLRLKRVMPPVPARQMGKALAMPWKVAERWEEMERGLRMMERAPAIPRWYPPRMKGAQPLAKSGPFHS